MKKHLIRWDGHAASRPDEQRVDRAAWHDGAHEEWAIVTARPGSDYGYIEYAPASGNHRSPFDRLDVKVTHDELAKALSSSTGNSVKSYLDLMKRDPQLFFRYVATYGRAKILAGYGGAERLDEMLEQDL